MIELRFHRELYERSAIDDAAATYQGFCGLSVAEDSAHWIVRLEDPKGAIDAWTLARELANYALGTTIERRGEARPEEERKA